ncbi:hypothetical protein E4M02_07240 [Brevundimonas sp. S30B]|uniref:hypothetical protein n=1 Tax=unclassified Brevundimonas TaxID=2622653 RepID=UPI00110083C8|nr:MULTISPECIES: hypothetical protein [unclassified Brevundimonas]TFW02772.1 hypothetical protein E4M02_07240 [Brevundimonas sp. S30B]
MNSVCFAILPSGFGWRVASAGETAGPYANRGQAFERAILLAQAAVDDGRPVEILYADDAGKPQALRLGPSAALTSDETTADPDSSLR